MHIKNVLPVLATEDGLPKVQAKQLVSLVNLGLRHDRAHQPVLQQVLQAKEHHLGKLAASRLKVRKNLQRGKKNKKQNKTRNKQAGNRRKEEKWKMEKKPISIR